jgi:hypothetical protein
MRYYPIIIFCYNRAHYLEKLLKSLKETKDFQKHRCYVFCDGPKNKNDKLQISSISKILSKFNFNKKDIIFRKKNIGLSENIICGVSKILKKNRAAIILEDDLILGNNSIFFINYNLNKFKNNKNYASVSAYSDIHNLKFKKKFYKFSLNRHSSWCWGTWSNKWNKVNWEKNYYEDYYKNFIKIKKINVLGNDMNLMLWGYTKNLINSWAIRFNFYCQSNSWLSIQPRFSLVNNIGAGTKGTNQKLSTNEIFQNLNKLNIADIKCKIYESKKFSEIIKRKYKPSLRLRFYFLFFETLNIFKKF